MKARTLDILVSIGVSAVGTAITVAVGALTPETKYFEIPMTATFMASIGVGVYLGIRRNRREIRENNIRVNYQIE